MSNRQQARFLPDGRRLHLQDGPIDLIIQADGARAAVDVAYDAACERFATLLDELGAELPQLRQRLTKDSAPPQGAVARRMIEAAQPYAAKHFITPMVAVAGDSAGGCSVRLFRTITPSDPSRIRILGCPSIRCWNDCSRP